MCSFLDKLATKYDKIFHFHLNNVATLPCKSMKYLFLTNLNGTMWMFAFKLNIIILYSSYPLATVLNK